jgi:hypothetical protein
LHEYSFIFPPETDKRPASIHGGMTAFGRIGALASLLAVVSSGSGAQGFGPDRGALRPVPQPWDGAMPPSPPPSYGARMETPRLLNDTPEYCAELLNAIGATRLNVRVVPPDVDVLAEEGQRLCQIGHFRPGIMRLRTALMILRRGK